jgi:hypothetical protein
MIIIFKINLTIYFCKYKILLIIVKTIACSLEQLKND